MYSDEFLDDPGHLCVFVTDNKDLKSRLLHAYHDSPLGMHRGRDNTYNALARDFYWRRMRKATKRWVARCLEFLKHKSTDHQHGLMHPRFYDKPMKLLGIDFVGPFPTGTTIYLPPSAHSVTSWQQYQRQIGVLLQLQRHCLIMYSLNWISRPISFKRRKGISH